MSIEAFVFKREDAINYGVEEAVILYHFRYWVETNKSNNTHNHDGRHWLYNSHKSLCELFPFFNEQKCKRLVQSLKDQGAIIVGNFNKKSYDRTNWYTINDDSSVSQKLPTQQSKLTEESVKADRPIPITTITNLSLPICAEPEASERGRSRIPSLKEKRNNTEVQSYKIKSSSWYQHYLKSSVIEQRFQSLPEEIKMQAAAIVDKEDFITFVNVSAPKSFTHIDMLHDLTSADSYMAQVD